MQSEVNKKVFIIAEAGVNHNGNLDMALELVKAARDAGADAIKFQTFKATRLASKTAKKAQYQLANTEKNESQQAMLAKLELKESWHFELKNLAEELGIQFLSTAFDGESLQFLQKLNLDRYKIPSGELINGPLLWRFAKTGKPLILSTGMATLSEVELALAIISYALHFTTEPSTLDDIWAFWSDEKARLSLGNKITLLHCTSQYPTPWHEVNLKAMDTLAKAFGLPVGYSDHTQGSVVPIAAVALGATVIEKHFTLDKSLPGPDHQASLDIEEFKKMVNEIRALELALGDGRKAPQPSEWEIRKIARQSLVAARQLSSGHILKEEDLTTARSEGGLSPVFYWDLLGEKTKKSYEEGEIL